MVASCRAPLRHSLTITQLIIIRHHQGFVNEVKDYFGDNTIET